MKTMICSLFAHWKWRTNCFDLLCATRGR